VEFTNTQHKGSFAMNHRRKGRKLNRNASHRLALFRNLSRSLITHETIRTTTPKAKELRPFIEKLITLAKRAALITEQAAATTDAKEKAALSAQALHLRRQAMAKLGPTHGTGIYDKAGVSEKDRQKDTVLKKLFNEIGPRFKTRPGGYTRVLKLSTVRLGDAGAQSIIEFIKEGETSEQLGAPVMPTAPTMA
jgi:large subunit ribosomal protein L17